MSPIALQRSFSLITSAKDEDEARHALGQPLLPESLNPLKAVAPDFLKSLKELTPDGVQHASEILPVSYVRIACDASDLNLLALPFVATQPIGNFGALPNDGLVGLDSALLDHSATSKRPGCWPVDHAGAIGWPTDEASLVRPDIALAAHHARFDLLLPQLLA